MNEYHDLTLTGEQVQERLNLVPTHTEAIATLQEAIKAFVNSEQVQSLIATALTQYSTTADMNAAISGAITSALTSYYTKTAADSLLAAKVDKVSGKQLSTEDFTKALKDKLDALPTNANLTTQISSAIASALTSYYTKTETATQIADAVAAALTAYYTKTQTDALVKEQADSISEVVKAIGLNVSETTIALTAAQTGQAVGYQSEKAITKSGYAISAPFSVTKGKVYIIPAATTPSSDVSPLSHVESRTFEQAIGYAYEVEEVNGEERIAKAIATYDTSLVYTYTYDAQGALAAIIDKNGQTVSALPETRTVTETYYLPMVEEGWTPARPGTFLFVAPKTMQVVVSNQTASVTGNIVVLDMGLTENIGHNWLSKFDDQSEIEALAALKAKIDTLFSLVDNLGDAKARSIDLEYLPRVCGEELVVEGAGAPAVVPMFVGQRYHDTTGKKVYEAFAVTNSTNDWVLLN